MKSKWVVLILAVVALSAASFAQTATTPIVATKAESLSISVSSFPASFNVMSPGTPQTLTTTSSWNVKPSRTGVAICVSLTTPLSGTTGNTDVIDGTMVQAQPEGTGPFTNINAGTGCGQPTATLITTHTANTKALRQQSNVSDTVAIQLGNNIPATFEADTYTGTITVYASAQ
ncbi:MAG TPA: hypothetical protein VKW78_13785 [Terriglobales bacterium]|nr:hypothetical protein [Terriglobales bacterium]